MKTRVLRPEEELLLRLLREGEGSSANYSEENLVFFIDPPRTL